MKIFFMGTVEFSYDLFESLLSDSGFLLNTEVVGISSLVSSTLNSDFKSLQGLAQKYGIPFYPLRGNDQLALAQILQSSEADALFCFGWPYLLKPEILNIPSRGSFGYHPAALPKNRGRHPIIWAIALGLSETASTFFKMGAGADDGDIVSQKSVSIHPEDNAGTLYRKLNEVARTQLKEVADSLSKRTLKPVPQGKDGNVWRKRSHKDGMIDWRMSAVTIHNLVRALHPPYPRASFQYGETEFFVTRTSIVKATQSDNLEPGRILDVGPEGISVKCGEGIIRLIEVEPRLLVNKGQYL